MTLETLERHLPKKMWVEIKPIVDGYTDFSRRKRRQPFVRTKMIKDIISIKLILICLIAVGLNGCTFIIKNDNSIKYYGIDEKRGSEVLNKILDKQQEAYQGQKEVKK